MKQCMKQLSSRSDPSGREDSGPREKAQHMVSPRIATASCWAEERCTIDPGADEAAGATLYQARWILGQSITKDIIS